MNDRFFGVMACTAEGIIGANGKVPWHYPDELKYFRSVIEGRVLIMGRKTFEGLLPFGFFRKARSIVFSNNFSLIKHYSSDRVRFVTSLEEFRQVAASTTSQMCMIGGGAIAALFLKRHILSAFFLTIIHKKYEGDTYFPLELIVKWKREVIVACSDYTIYRYTCDTPYTEVGF